MSETNDHSTADSVCTASTPTGTYRGRSVDGVRTWLGIRYALPPSGDRRWRDPVAPPPADEEIDATAYGSTCPQQRSPAIALAPDAVLDEDCLFLNVFAPDRGADAPRPVMVWIHGGAYVFGGSDQPLYDPTSLITHGDVVVVTINYRLGGFGFLNLDGLLPASGFDGNLALKDVLLALQWVNENIAAFGGDAGRITVFGESAGAGLVTALLATPRASGLFHRAIIESSPASSMYGPSRATAVARRFVEALGLDPARETETASALRLASVDAIVEATMRVYADVPDAEPGTLAFAPVVDADLLPEAPITALKGGRGLPVPLMIGTNKDEASLFRFMKSPLLPITGDRIEKMFADMAAENPGVELPTREQVLTAYEQARHHTIGLGIARDIGFRMPTLWVAEGHSTANEVWLYRFDHATPFLRVIGLGATHASELPYVWGRLGAGKKDPTFRLGGRRVAEALSTRMQQRWTAFAHGRNPDADGAASWERFEAGEDAARMTLVIDARDTCVADLDAPLRRAWGETVLAFD